MRQSTKRGWGPPRPTSEAEPSPDGPLRRQQGQEAAPRGAGASLERHGCRGGTGAALQPPGQAGQRGTGAQAGWYVVWQLFLSKFKFLRELIGDTGSQQGDNEPSEAEAEQETPPSPQRGRQKSARQRRAHTEDTT
ncbi:PREDICTED: small integral membrane protein 13 [Chaetura pelagica]|uniref:small integral membrane protein 13 n=1 Tax=Chaetura pelagica TaxID=8897 RepID=UPI000523459C|nr:PREDICTED: small integral membrane protein 13 [Chaetura pelagica]